VNGAEQVREAMEGSSKVRAQLEEAHEFGERVVVRTRSGASYDDVHALLPRFAQFRVPCFNSRSDRQQMDLVAVNYDAIESVQRCAH
jgi:hypothetical protein